MKLGKWSYAKRCRYMVMYGMKVSIFQRVCAHYDYLRIAYEHKRLNKSKERV